MPEDLEATVDALAGSGAPFLRELGQRIRGHLAESRMIVAAHPFWTTWRFFTQFPKELHDTLSQADLIVFKGDANYRRIASDRHWPPTTRLEAISSGIPTSFVVMRTLKSELIVGLQEGDAERLDPRVADALDCSLGHEHVQEIN